MILLTLRTDAPEAELGLYDGERQLAYEVWPAHRELSATIHRKLQALLNSQHVKLSDISGIVCFKGPGSFTGLRIGLSVANALAYGLHVPIIATENPGWLETGIARLLAGEDEHIATPEYGSPVHTTAQKH